jgi:hypothetical protein
MEPLGLILSVVYDVLKNKDKFWIPSLNGIISNCIDKVSERNDVDRNLLIELLSSNEIQNQVISYKKSGSNPDKTLLQDNLSKILQNNNNSANIDTIVDEIIHELEDAIISDIETYKKIQLNYSRDHSNKLDEIYEIVKQLNPEKKNTCKDENSFSGFGFHISWPKNWVKLTTKEISTQLENLEGHLSNFGLPSVKLPIVFQVWTKNEYEGFHPNVFISVEDCKTNKITDIHNPIQKEAIENFANVIRYDVDVHFNTANIETKETLFVDNYQIQKWIIKNGQLYNLVITELTEDAMKKEPSLFDEIKHIAQSFSWN